MIEFLIILIAIGFCIVYFARHPINTMKFVGAGIGLLILGFITLCLLLVGLAAIG